MRALHTARLAAIGTETARSLQEHHLRADLVPEDFRAEGLLEAMAHEDLRGARVLLPRAARARATLPEGLRARGAQVDEVVTYESVPPEGGAECLRAALESGPLDCLTFTSSSTVTSFLELLDRADPSEGRRRIARARIACIGPITARTAREAGLRVDVVPREYTIPALAAAVVEVFHAEEG
jgi:uroporphyrinogen III methyltransferase/synthase